MPSRISCNPCVREVRIATDNTASNRGWTPEQLDYMHDVSYWAHTVGRCKGAEVIEVKEMESNEEVWADWLAQDNEYAVGDRKSMEAGGGKYLNFISIVLRKR